MSFNLRMQMRKKPDAIFPQAIQRDVVPSMLNAGIAKSLQGGRDVGPHFFLRLL